MWGCAVRNRCHSKLVPVGLLTCLYVYSKSRSNIKRVRSSKSHICFLHVLYACRTVATYGHKCLRGSRFSAQFLYLTASEGTDSLVRHLLPVSFPPPSSLAAVFGGSLYPTRRYSAPEPWHLRGSLVSERRHSSRSKSKQLSSGRLTINS